MYDVRLDSILGLHVRVCVCVICLLTVVRSFVFWLASVWFLVLVVSGRWYQCT